MQSLKINKLLQLMNFQFMSQSLQIFMILSSQINQKFKKWQKKRIRNSKFLIKFK